VTSRTQSTVSLRHYIEVLWRRRLLILITVLVVPAAILGFSLTREERFASAARIIAVNQSAALKAATNLDISIDTPDQRGLQTLATFIATPEVARRAAEKLGYAGDPGVLMRDVSAEADPNADIIRVTAESATGKGAAALANAFAESFVEWRKETHQASLDQALQLVEAQLKVAAVGSEEHALLLERRSQLEILKTLVTGEVAVGEEAQTPSTPASPKPMRDGALAVAAALVLGLALAFVREALDIKVHSAEEIGELTDVPVIGAIPEISKQDRTEPALLTLTDSRGPSAEAFRFLRTNVEFVNFNRDIKVILVTSPQPSQGKSTTIANLAVALVRAGKRVAVVEGDLRRPAIHRFFKIANARGVTSVVSGTATLAEAVQSLTFKESTMTLATTARTPASSGKASAKGGAGASKTTGELTLTVLPAGLLPPNPGEIVSSRQLDTILDDLKRDHDYVLVDAPPMFAVGDAAAMAGKVDGLIVVLKLNETTRETLRAVQELLDRLPSRTLGFVVTGVPRGSKGRFYRYEDYYG
jgi:receptor protein-tyrosine kinase